MDRISKCTQSQLILHFDLNKTIILSDSIKKLNAISSIRELCCQSAWGIISQDGEWKLTEVSLSFQRPKEGLISYMEFLNTEFPINDLQYIKNASKSELIESFFKANHPGEALNGIFEKICSTLLLSANVMKIIHQRDDEVSNLLKSGSVFILMSLFTLIIKLYHNKRDFKVIFRTFGSDLHNIIIEFNEFCNGNHPLFNGENGFPKVKFNGIDGTPNLLISDSNSGFIIRDSKIMDDITLIEGTLNRKKDLTGMSNLYIVYAEEIAKKTIKIVKSGYSIYTHLMNQFQYFKSFAIQDHFESWFQNKLNSQYGKPFLVDPYDTSIHQVFFDDNIKDNEFSIVDCRNVITGESIDIAESWNKYIYRVDTIQAVMDNDYYYKCVMKSEEKRSREISTVSCRFIGIDQCENSQLARAMRAMRAMPETIWTCKQVNIICNSEI